MTSINYLNSVLTRYNTTPRLLLPFTPAYQTMAPILRLWAGNFLLNLGVSGSNAKGTAIAGVADLDLFISLNSRILNTHTLARIYNSLAQRMRQSGYTVRRQNVSVRINHRGAEVDLVPGVRFSGNTSDHWLYITKSGRDRTKTNINTRIKRVLNSGRIGEIRLTKIWRELNNLDFPSIYLEETVINCLSGYRVGNLVTNFWRVLGFLENGFSRTTVFDPANISNIISNELTVMEKRAISTAATVSRAQPTWRTIVW